MYRDDQQAALLRAAKLDHENAELQQENAELKKRLAKRERRVTKLLWRDLGRKARRYTFRTVAAALGAFVSLSVGAYATAPEVPTTSSANLSDAGVPPPHVPDRDPSFAFRCTAGETEFAYPCRNTQPMTRVFWNDARGFCAPHLHWDASRTPPSSISTMPTGD